MDEPIGRIDEKGIPELHPLAQSVSEALEGAVFPLDRPQICAVARENESPKILISLINLVPDRTYLSLDEVQEALQGQALDA